MTTSLAPFDFAILDPHVFADLPAASAFPGLEAYITDGSTNAIGAIVAGSGANKVIVRSDGTNYLVMGGGGGTTTPGGSNTDIQFNNSGAFGGDGGLVYNGSGSITLTDGSNFITLSPNSGTSPLIEIFYSGQFDAKITLASGVFLFNGGITTTGAIVCGGTFEVNSTLGSVATGSSPSNTAPGILELWSATGASPFITWSEKGVANRGAFGFKHGDSKLYYYSGTESIDSGGTLGFTCDANGNFSAATVAHVATTIAGLPSPVAGMVAYVTDGDSGLAWGATATNSGAGATKYLVWYNGTNWTVAGK